jgi:hypothetical protein
MVQMTHQSCRSSTVTRINYTRGTAKAFVHTVGLLVSKELPEASETLKNPSRRSKLQELASLSNTPRVRIMSVEFYQTVIDIVITHHTSAHSLFYCNYVLP